MTPPERETGPRRDPNLNNWFTRDSRRPNQQNRVLGARLDGWCSSVEFVEARARGYSRVIQKLHSEGRTIDPRARQNDSHLHTAQERKLSDFGTHL